MKVDLSVRAAGVSFSNPVTVASGTFGFGREYGACYDLSRLGGIAVKGLTLRPREGNPPPRIAETPMGILNSVGLQNPGIEAFIEHEIPFLRRHSAKIIANISGHSLEEYAVMAEMISAADVDIIELNVSCPNVKEGGMAFGVQEQSLHEVVSMAKKKATKPLFVKLSPNVTDIARMATIAAGAGADGLSLINTLLGMRIDVDTRRPVLKNNMGGLSGPAILPVAVRMVHQVRQAVDLPIIGMGGIASGRDAIEMMLAGADLIAIGTAQFIDPLAPVRILEEMKAYCSAHGVAQISSITGTVEVY